MGNEMDNRELEIKYLLGRLGYYRGGELLKELSAVDYRMDYGLVQ